MLKRIIIAAILWPLLAFGQSYPSPTFNNVTSQGTATLNNATVSGTFTATGKIGLASLAAQAANTVVGNATGSSASPTAITVTGCNGAAQALQWTNGSGFGCNSAIATSGANSNITSLSGLSTALSVAQGGTGATSASAALTSLGAAPAASPTFTGTVTTAALTSTGAFTPSQTNGIVGTTTNNSANAGAVGEYICAQVTNGGSPAGCATNSSTPVSLTTGVATNVASISLTAGDWDVWGEVITVPGATTTIAAVSGWISTASATLPNGSGSVVPWFYLAGSLTTGQGTAMPITMTRISLASTTTVFLGAFTSFGTSTMSAYGFIGARRRR
jgi:hypothetical protein